MCIPLSICQVSPSQIIHHFCNTIIMLIFFKVDLKVILTNLVALLCSWLNLSVSFLGEGAILHLHVTVLTLPQRSNKDHQTVPCGHQCLHANSQNVYHPLPLPVLFVLGEHIPSVIYLLFFHNALAYTLTSHAV